MITPVDLLAPKGPVEVTLFPGESNPPSPTLLETRLQEYIDQAEDKVAGIAFPQPDEAVKAWALYLTFEAAYVLAISRAANENTMVPVLGSQGFTKDQRDGLKAKSTYYADAFQSLLIAVPPTSEIQPRGYVSTQTQNAFEW